VRGSSRPARPDLDPALERLHDEPPEVVALLPDVPQEILLVRVVVLADPLEAPLDEALNTVASVAAVAPAR
jgi:hypothetical protein